MLWRGWPIEKLLLFFSGHLEGGQPGARPARPADRHSGRHAAPHAVGLAYAAQYRGDDAVVMAYFGDGATSEGDFHEAMNFAGVWHVPVVFVVPEQPVGDLGAAQEADAFADHRPEGAGLRLPGIQVDGNDVLAVYAARREAVGRARGGGRSDADRVRDVPSRRPHHRRRSHEVPLRTRKWREWERKDPLTRFRAYLQKRNLLDEGVEARSTPRSPRRWRGSRRRRPPDPLTIFDHVYARAAARSRGPARELAARLARRARDAAADAEASAAASPPMRGQRTTRR